MNSTQLMSDMNTWGASLKCVDRWWWYWGLKFHWIIESSAKIYSLLGNQSVADAARHGRWFGHLEHKSVYDLLLACGKVEVGGELLNCPWKDSYWFNIIVVIYYQLLFLLFRVLWSLWNHTFATNAASLYFVLIFRHSSAWKQLNISHNIPWITTPTIVWAHGPSTIKPTAQKDRRRQISVQRKNLFLLFLDDWRLAEKLHFSGFFPA